jgi:energy-converting hydrogenase Eha subunit A
MRTLITLIPCITYSFSTAKLPYYSAAFSAFHILSSYIDAMYFNIIYSLSYCFPHLPPHSPLRQTHGYNHVFSLSICVCM